jgi:hypothetical protein
MFLNCLKQRYVGHSAWSCWFLAVACFIGTASECHAGFIFDFASQGSFQVINTNGDGSVNAQPTTVVITGPNNGSMALGTTDYTATAVVSGTVMFDWSYSTCSPTMPPVCNAPTFTFAGYLVNGSFFSLADTNGQSGQSSFAVNSGDTFGFRVGSLDNMGEPGILTLTSEAPEPRTLLLVLTALSAIILFRFQIQSRPSVRLATSRLRAFVLKRS